MKLIALLLISLFVYTFFGSLGVHVFGFNLGEAKALGFLAFLALFGIATLVGWIE